MKSKFNIDNLSEEGIKLLSTEIGTKIRNICDKSVIKINKILNKYNMECKIAFHIQELGSFPEKKTNLIHKV